MGFLHFDVEPSFLHFVKFVQVDLYLQVHVVVFFLYED
jgi:hypothetical protein